MVDHQFKNVGAAQIGLEGLNNENNKKDIKLGRQGKVDFQRAGKGVGEYDTNTYKTLKERIEVF